ncbi:MAG: OmpH family outer membrane protein [Treponema sp.]|jgi:Skp family chaperone for outer membrane proteins|nr:OmpH family outer membrane protein [Treponema sp.]
MIVLLLFVILIPLFGQQLNIPKVGVLDSNRIFPIITANIPEFRAYNEKRARYDAEKEKKENELRELRASMIVLEAEPQSRNRDQNIRNMQNQINVKRKVYLDYVQANSAELEREEQQLKENRTFRNRLTAAVEEVAKTEGISLVLDKSQPEILWAQFDRTFDITQKVIDQIRRNR